MTIFARTLLAGMLAALGLALVGPAASPHTGRVVYLARGLSDEALIVLGACLAGRDDAVLLLDSDKRPAPLQSFLHDYHPDRLVPVGSFPDGADLEKRLGIKP